MKSYLIKNTLLLCLLIPIISCSTLSKDECKTANWKTIGYGDGTQGYKASRISGHRKACAEHGVQPNLNAYTLGRDKGLVQYCIPNTAYNHGVRGYSYNSVCTAHNEPAFRQAYNYGVSIYEQIVILKNMQRDFANEQEYIISLEQEIHDNEHRIISGHLPKYMARRLLNETKEREIMLDRARYHIPELENDIYQQQQHIDQLKSNRTFH
ncbi:MAG: DUF2799 domain-containing protein [Woeseiaceae bacterium]